MSDNGNGTSIISKPSGGGAIGGMGEKFSPDLFTGTGNFSVPIALPPGRNGFQPDITLVYSSGNGSGVFGLGWNLSVPGVARKTSKGIPLYDDDKDVFILSGAEDLVEISRESLENGGYKATFRPRTEGLFARIERYKDKTNDYWKVWSKDGLISYYGTPELANTYNTYNDPAVCADPAYRSKIFQWFLSKTQDVFGNTIEYSYTRENRLPNASGDDPHDYDMLYLSTIHYSGYGANKFLCSVKFLYEDRPDPISVYKQGFEMRTTKRATTIELYTHPEVETVVQNILTKKYHFIYLDKRVKEKEISPTLLPINGVSMLSQVKIEGIDGVNSEWMPPLEFGYSGFEPQHRNFDPVTGSDMPPESLASRDYEMADMFGDGLPDIIQLNGVARYWRNLGDGRFDMPRFMKEIPAGAKLADPQIQLIDADGDGRLDLLYNKPGVNGYYSMKPDGLWDHSAFKKHKNTPSFSLSDPEVKLLDLDGDGITDVLRNGSRLECFLNDPVEGFYKTITVEKKRIRNFPNLSFADPRIKFADMCGDGLQDIVQIQDGSICYWPNLGYGNFGAMVQMKKCPRFPYRYNPALIQLGDVDGDGCTDLIYVENNQVTLWVNRSGESWSDPIVIHGTPPVTNPNAIRFTDIKGTGIAGLVWSYDFTVNPGRERMFILDFTQGIKPYVLNEMNNHMGAITRVEYKSSIYYYLKDRQRGQTNLWPGNELGVLPNGKRTPWKTTLPFPVQVVSRVEVIDELSKGKLVTEYSYHHGYWDGGEREFRGFGRVHQRDTESFTRYNESISPFRGGRGEEFLPVENVHYIPPTETISWFHLGPVGGERGDWKEVYFEDEYWDKDPQVLKRPSQMITMINSLPRRARRDAYRTLRGSSLRTELYALDNDANNKRPYTVSENLQGVRLEYSYPIIARTGAGSSTQPVSTQPWGADENNKQGSGYIFFAQALASRSTQWERGFDPMTSFSFTEDYDQYGNPQMQIAMAVPRGKNPLTGRALSISPFGEGAGGGYLTTMNKTNFIHKDDATHYLIGRAAETKSYEVENDGTTSVFTLKESVINNQSTNNLLSHSLNYYDGDAFSGLAHGSLGDYGVPVRTEILVMTEENVDEIYDTRPVYIQDNETPGTPSWTADYPSGFQTALPVNAGYKYYGGGDSIHLQGYYCEADRKKFDFHDNPSTAKGLMLQSKDPLGNTTTVAYDDYKLFPLSVTDPLGMQTVAEYDYRVMQASQITDPNENRAQFAFSPLGFLIKTYVLGKVGESEPQGDTDPDKPGTLMEYNFFAFANNRQPVFVKTTVREHHAADEVNDDTIESIQYSDGFGRLLQTRTQAEETIFGDSVFGDSGLDMEGASDGDAQGITNNGAATTSNVIVSGWQVYNNKGKVVEKYEPYYDKGFSYNPPNSLVLEGRSFLDFTSAGEVRFPDAAQYDFGTGNFTIETWIYCRGDGYDTIVSNFGSNKGFDFYVYTQKLVLFLSDGDSYAQARSISDLSLNVWHHVAVVRLGDDPDNFLFYIDGEESAGEQWGYGNLSNGNISGSTADLTIGSYTNADYFSGMLRGVRLYNRQCTVGELEDNYVAGLDAAPSSVSGLVLNAPLNVGQGTVIRDNSSYGAAGSITGTGVEWTEKKTSQKIRMFYDPRGHVIRTVNPDNTEQKVIFGVPRSLSTPTLYSPTPWESYTYDANDLKAITHPSDTSVPDGHRYTPSSSVIDPLGRTIKTIDRNYKDSAVEEIVMQYVYDIQGNLLEVKDPYNRTVFLHEYDFANRPLKTTHIDGGTKYVVMDCMSRPVEMCDAKGALVMNAYDELNRPTKIWARDKTDDATTLRQKMLYGDSAGLTNPEDNNLKGKLYKQYDEAGLTTIAAYDFKGQVPEKVRRVIKDEELLGVFDGPPANWQVEAYRVDWDTATDSILATTEYTTSMEYDALGRVTRMTYPEDVDGERKILLPAYNRSGALESVQLKDTEIASPVTYVDRIAYNARGQKILTALGNGTMTRYLYRSDNFRLLRMKSEGYEKTTVGNTVTYEKQSGTIRQNFTYEYDLSGNIISITDTTTGCGVGGSNELVREFEYDALYRLLSATGRETASAGTTPWNDYYRPNDNILSRAYTQNYDYDKLGNIQQLQHIATSGNFTRSFNYVSGKNKLDTIEVGANTYSFTHDVNGNIIQEDTNRHYKFDYADRLKSFYLQSSTEEPSIYAQYFYDAEGNRVKKITRTQSGGIKTTVYIDGIFEHSKEDASSNGVPNLTIGTWRIGTYGTGGGEQNTLHIMDGSSRVATRRLGDDFGDTTPAIKYNLEDHLGSSNLLLSTDGTLVSKEEYYPFGETSFGSFGKKRYRFCGKEKDEESGLYYFEARYYNAWTCRFTSTDPMALKNSYQSPYQYASNNPINRIDPTGMDDTKPGGNQGKSGNATNVPFPTNPKEDQTYTHEGKTYTYNAKGGWIRSEPEAVVTGTRPPKAKSGGSNDSGMKAGFIGAAPLAGAAPLLGAGIAVAIVLVVNHLLGNPLNLFKDPTTLPQTRTRDKEEPDTATEDTPEEDPNTGTGRDKPVPVPTIEDESKEKYIYRAMKMDADGKPNVPPSLDTPYSEIFSSHLAARDEDVKGLRNGDGTVSPGHKKGGMSTSLVPQFPESVQKRIDSGKLTVFRIRVSDLAKYGLIADPDGGAHVSVQPAVEMKEKQFQANIRHTRSSWQVSK